MANTQLTEAPAPSGGMVRFVQDTWAELHRVQWPTQETIIKHTVVVVSLVVFMAIYVGSLEAVFGIIFARISGTTG